MEGFLNNEKRYSSRKVQLSCSLQLIKTRKYNYGTVRQLRKVVYRVE